MTTGEQHKELAFHHELIRAGLMSASWAKFYDRIYEDRHESDYLLLATFEKEYVGSQIKLCSEFLEQLRPLVRLPEKL